MLLHPRLKPAAPCRSGCPGLTGSHEVSGQQRQETGHGQCRSRPLSQGADPGPLLPSADVLRKVVTPPSKSIQKHFMTTSTTLTNQLATRVAAVAVTLMFVVNGMVIGGYGGLLPSLRDKLGLGASHIAIMLFCGGAAAILAMQIGGRLADSRGAREVSLAAVPILVVGIIIIGVAPIFAIAILGSVVVGLGNGAMDVAMNAIGVQVEAARQRPIMSFFHAFWSIGTFIGAGAVLLLATVLGLQGGVVVTPLSIVIAVVALLALGVLFKITPEAAVVHHKVDGVKAPIPKSAWILAIMALAFGLSEGTATDWSSIHVTDVAGVDPTIGAIGLVTVSAFMVVIRLLGDRLVTRFGRRAVVRFGGLCAGLGYLTVTLVSSLPLLVLGWASGWA